MPIEATETGEIIESQISSARTFQNEATSEIISREPGFIIRWGISIFFFVLLSMSIICWFIQYPDVVYAGARLVSVNAPKPVICKTEGKLIRLLATENQQVSKGTIVGYMESIGSHQDVLQLESYLHDINYLSQTGQKEKLPAYLNIPFTNLGELQQPYQTFMQSFIAYRNYLPDGFYSHKKGMIHGDIQFLQQLHGKLEQQQKLQEYDLSLAQKTFDANQSLKAEKVISDFDYRNEESKLVAKQLNVPQTAAGIISNESQQHEKKKEMMELDNTMRQQEIIFLQAINILKNQIYEWKNKYLLIAPLDGKISFTGFLQENQQLRMGQAVAYVTPPNSSFYAEMLIPQNNFGKVVTGQTVQLHFIAYPSQEYGSVFGTLDFISPNATDSGYIAKAVFPNGLKTNYNKQLQYKEGLMASAQVITVKKRLLQRFFESIQKALQ